MRIGFDAGPVFSLYGGIGQYVRSLFAVLARMAPDIEWIGYSPHTSSPHPLLDSLPGISWCSEGPLSGLFGNNSGREKLDVFHGTNFKAPRFGQKRTVLTIHDLWMERYPQFSKKMLGQGLSTWKMGTRVKRVDHIIAVSKFSSQEIQEFYGISQDKITVVYHGSSKEMYRDYDPNRFDQARIKMGLPSGNFILFLGGAEPRKNHRVVFEAFRQSRLAQGSCFLVVVGDVCARGQDVRRTAHELGISRYVRCTGHVSPTYLRLLFSHAEAFVFSSLYEGFGIPILEAMACGAPLIASNRTAIPEIAGDAAMYFDHSHPEELSLLLDRLIMDPLLQEHLRQKGYDRIRQFSWERAARETLAVYREVGKGS